MTLHEEMLTVADSFPSWTINLLLVGLVFFQAIIFGVISMQYYKKFDVTHHEIKRAVRSGLITTIGPALSIFIVGLGLITQIGAPLTLSRLSVVGNAVYEATAAEFGASVMGTSISSADYGLSAYTCSVWVMNLGGALMLVLPLLFTRPLSKVRQKVNKKGSIGKIIGISASLASFGYFSLDYAAKDSGNLVAVCAAFVMMIAITLLGNKFRITWIKEWALAFSIVGAIIAASMVM